MARHWSISIVTKYVIHPTTTVAVAMVAGDEEAEGAVEVDTDAAAEVVVTVAVVDAVAAEAVAKTMNVSFKKSNPILMILRNPPRHHREVTLVQLRALREAKLVLSLNRSVL